MLSNLTISHSASNNLTLINHAAESDSQEYILDESSYEALINHLNTLTPFEAIRYANEINKMNGFEVVSGVVVKEWKKAASENLKIKFGCDKGRSFSRNQNEKFMRIEKLNFKMTKVTTPYSELQKGYMKLINQ